MRVTTSQLRAIARVIREHRGKHSSRPADSNRCHVCQWIPEALAGVEYLERESERRPWWKAAINAIQRRVLQ